eukprot:GHVH01005424.1.p2 GENE.GHVH01005424.1~~GHVH01005424.1.p2  ORF type:complete len:382 (+),score=57.66 GHVH01005424.1:1743-2888(+)
MSTKTYGVRNLPVADPDEVAKLVATGLLPSVPPPDELDYTCALKDTTLVDGQLVTLFGGHNLTATVRIASGTRLSNGRGDFYYDDMIGCDMGSKSWDRTKPKWAAVLPPSPELHMTTLRHRTQILYTQDISYSIMQMDLKVGSRVVESGTGSGAMSYFLSQTVSSSGRVFTFENHPQRYKEAVEDCVLLQQTEQLRNYKRNAYRDGFMVDSSQARECCDKINVLFDETSDLVSSENPVDAVFLDLPEPWKALDHANDVLKDDGVIVIFSPCIEQVLTVVEKLTEMKWDVHREVVETINFTWNAMVFGQGRMASKRNKNVQDSHTSHGAGGGNQRVLASARDPRLLSRGVPVDNVWPQLTPTPGHTGYLIHTRKPITKDSPL